MTKYFLYIRRNDGLDLSPVNPLVMTRVRPGRVLEGGDPVVVGERGDTVRG